MIALGIWALFSVLSALAWSEHQREWKRRRGTFTLPHPPSTPAINTAHLVQSLRTQGYRGIHPADRNPEP